MSDVFKGCINLLSLTTSTFGISCEQNDNLIRIEIDLNTIIYMAIILTTILVAIFSYNLLKERSVRIKSSTN